MTSGAAVDVYVFLFAFASAFLLGGKRPFLALSTRAMLLVLLGLALTYAVGTELWYRAYVGVATLVANGLFVAFAAIDYARWRKTRAHERG